MTVKVTVPNGSSDSVVFGSANTPLAAQVSGYDDGSSKGHIEIYTNNGSGLVEAVRIDNAQNVGVGTTSPAAKLDAFQSSTGTYFLGGGGDNKARQLAIKSSTTTNSGDTHTFDAQSGSGVLAFSTTGIERARIDTSGNLSNTASITSGTFTKATTYVWASGSGTAGGYYLGIGSDNGRICQASAGAASTSTYIGTQQITTSSDVRLKDNIVDTQRNALELIGQLRVVDHTWNDPSDQCETNKNSRGVWMGLIAQEAQPIIPWLVNKPKTDVDEDGNPQYWFMDYGYSVPFLIKAIQEQQAMIATQSEAIAQLTSRIEALENK